MDDRSANVLQHAETADALLSGGLAGESLFVINLCAANVPQAIDAGSVQTWGIAGIARYKLYQVSRMEDGRRRYRVRLGFFTSEADAEFVLQSVRGKFATAFSSCLADEDLKHASGYLKKPLQEIQEIQDLQRTGRYRIPKFDDAHASNGSAHSETTTAPKQTAQPKFHSAAPVKALHKADEAVVEFEWTPAPKTNPQEKVRAAASAKLAAYIAASKATTNPSTEKAQARSDTSHAPKPAVPAPTPSTAATGRFHVAAGRNIPDHGFELTDDAPAFAAKKPAAANSEAHSTQRSVPQSKPAHGAASKSTELPRALVSAEALAKLRAAAQPRQPAAIIPTLDSTQTIRTLTKSEKDDENAPRWYVVQLAVSDQPANLDTMPRLDIFEAYRLYSVATMDGAVIRHALRLGFFKEEVSAEAVLGYLKTFFGDPHIERVSDAEQRRFIEPPAPKAAQPIETPKSQSRVITLEEKRGAKLETIDTTPAPVHAPKPAPVERRANKSEPAAKRSPSPAARKPTKAKSGKYAHLSVEERVAIKEARMLGLSDTAIRRVDHNSSLLSRLVGKLTK
jgi:hypothetical protein